MKLKQIATLRAGYPFRSNIPDVAGSSAITVLLKNVSLTGGIRWSDCLKTALTGQRAAPAPPVVLVRRSSVCPSLTTR